MGYFFTLLYIATAYLTPELLFGTFAEYHVEVIFVALAIVFSLPKLQGSGLLRAPQTLAFAGICFAIVAASIGTTGLHFALNILYGFMQPVFFFYLVALNCKTKRHYQGIILVLAAASTFFIYEGVHELNNHVIPSAYLYGDGLLRRLRGLGFVNDPNDFAQVLVALIPCMFLGWKKNWLMNAAMVVAPIAILITGMYFTHSRGGSLAMLAVILLASRRRVGTIPAAILAGILFAIMFGLGWSGGRDVSMEAGSDRLALWSAGMQMIKAHPFFGAGIGAFTEALGITAHNSVVICAAETGIVGLFFWCLLVFSTLSSGVRLASLPSVKRKEEQAPIEEEFPWLHNEARVDAAPGSNDVLHDQHHLPSAVGTQPFSLDVATASQMSDDDIRKVAKLFSLGLVGMLTAGWFLSRPFSHWLFLYCGVIYGLVRMSLDRGLLKQSDSLGFLLRWSGVITVGLMCVVYMMLRLRAF